MIKSTYFAVLICIVSSKIIANDNQVFKKDKCTKCQSFIDDVIEERRRGSDITQLTARFQKLCDIYKYVASKCEGSVLKNVPVFAYAVDHNPNLDGKRFCSLKQKQGCDKGDNYEWSLHIPERPLNLPKKMSFSSSFKILHISDVHYEPNYTPNKTKECDETLCCLSHQEEGNVEKDTACGYWGEYQNTDTPKWTVEEVFRQASTHDFEYVYVTGDLVNHMTWSTSPEYNTKIIKTVFRKMREAFKVPVYFTVGNHEPDPVNTYSILHETNPSLSTRWLYVVLSKEMSDYLLAGDEFLNSGFYSVSPRKGFRIVVLNNNLAHVKNWWLLYDDFDPNGQLRWLIKTLKQAEETGENVHILSHIPTGNKNLLKVWAREYNRILERFSDTVKVQFNGHTHEDGFFVYYSNSNTSKAINVAWNGGSIMPDGANPNYKIHKINSKSFELLDSEIWTFNLTKANENFGESPDWYKLYSVKEEYELNTLEASDVDSLVYRMAKHPKLIKKYYRNRYRNGGTADVKCGKKCQKKCLCKMVVTEYDEETKCDELKDIYDNN